MEKIRLFEINVVTESIFSDKIELQAGVSYLKLTSKQKILLDTYAEKILEILGDAFQSRLCNIAKTIN